MFLGLIAKYIDSFQGLLDYGNAYTVWQKLVNCAFSRMVTAVGTIVRILRWNLVPMNRIAEELEKNLTREKKLEISQLSFNSPLTHNTSQTPR